MATENYSPIGSSREAEESFMFHAGATIVLFLLAVAILVLGGYLTVNEVLTGGGVNAGWAGMLTLLAFLTTSYFMRESFRATQPQERGRPR